MNVLPNPDKEAINLSKHGFDFSFVGKLFRGFHVVVPDDRPLGYEHEGRLQLTGTVGDDRVFILIYEPVEISEDEMAAKPISLRKAQKAEARKFLEGRAHEQFPW
jgi:uncharacterized DUF497 family protein